MLSQLIFAKTLVFHIFFFLKAEVSGGSKDLPLRAHRKPR